jgi:hypothetical protein
LEKEICGREIVGEILGKEKIGERNNKKNEMAPSKVPLHVFFFNSSNKISIFLFFCFSNARGGGGGGYFTNIRSHFR